MKAMDEEQPEPAESDAAEDGPSESGPSLLSNHVEPDEWERVSRKSRPLVFEFVIAIVTIVVAIGTFVYVLIRRIGDRQRPGGG